MNVLLDTHTFLWWIGDDPRLSPRAREVIADGENTVFLSAASGWEIAIKARLGKLRLTGTRDLERFVVEQIATNAFTALPVHLSHALHAYTLPLLHRDPFDRLLVAQSQLEHMPIITNDRWIQRYPVETIW
ncbi:MAG: type II toxin-antitoxin system VapC family toxin [Anaerolineae bacterium]|nr:type II toxin-antitoxin system VapC family toxin [Anaerolineae bacterium]